MDLLYFARSAATTMITHHSRAATASARRLRPASPQATLTRISTAAVRIALLFTLPFTLLALLFIRLSNALRFQPRRVLIRRRQHTPRQTVLLTSNRASNPLALSLARTLHGAGTTVAVAHSSSSSPPALPPSRFASLLSSILPPPTSFSAAVASSLRLRIPARRQRQEDESSAEEDHHDDSASLYEHEVLGAILRVRPSVWVPCELLVDYDDDDDDDAAADDAAVVREAVGLLRETLRREAERERPRVRCGVLAPEGPVAGVVAGEDDVGVFRRLVEGLDCGVEVVGGRDVVVRRRGEVHGILHAGRRERKRWELVEPEGGEVVQLPVDDDYGCLDETYERLARLDISDARPWVMREVIEGEAYRIHAIVLNGAVRAFAVSTPADAHELDAGRLFLAPSSPLHASIQAFVNAFVAALPGRPSLPLAIDLTVRTLPTATGTVTRIHPTRCSWNLLPLTTTPPFSTAAAELVASVSPPPQPQRSPPRQQQPVDTDDEPVPAAAPAPPPSPPPTTDPAAQPTKQQSIPPAAAAAAATADLLHTPPSSPVLNPLVMRFVASTLPPTPPSSPDSRRSRSVDADNASSSSSPPRSSLRRSKRDVAAQAPPAAVRSRCYACSSPRRRASSDESGSESSGRGSGSGSDRKAGRGKVRFEELPPPVSAPLSSSSLSAATATVVEPQPQPQSQSQPQSQPQPQPQQQHQVRGDEAAAGKNSSSSSSSSSEQPAKRGSSSDADVSAVVPGVAGTYSLPRTLWAYVLLPLLDQLLFSLRPRRGVVAVAQGAAVLVERVLLPGAWVEEGWRWWDAGPWLWEWGVRRLVGV